MSFLASVLEIEKGHALMGGLASSECVELSTMDTVCKKHVGIELSWPDMVISSHDSPSG